MNAVPTFSAYTEVALQPGVLSLWRGFIPASKRGRLAVPDDVRDHVVGEVSAETGVTVREIMGRDRTQRVFGARAEAIQRLRAMRQGNGAPRYSLNAIGRAFDRDHATIFYAVSKRKRGRATA